jgi:hypothetical protein
VRISGKIAIIMLLAPAMDLGAIPAPIVPHVKIAATDVKVAPAKPTKPKLPIHFDGNLRAYYFTREFGNSALSQQTSFSLGGKLNFLTDAFWNGFRIGGTVYTAQSLGLNSDYYQRQDRTLPGSPITVLGQSYGQYENPYVLMRIGNQVITTPWENDADSRMIPATYQGLLLTVTPVRQLSLIGMRMISFKGRPADHFSKTNLYNPSNISLSNIPALGNKEDIGTLAFGAKYHQDNFRMKAWVYHFYNYANLAYADFHYQWVTNSILKPLIAGQLGHEWNSGSEILNGLNHGSAHANILGALVGVEIGKGKMTVGGNYLPSYKGAYLNGDVVSPYTAGYQSDPLYTTSMNAGLIEKSAGSAVKVELEYKLFNDSVFVSTSYARYFTQPYLKDSDETDIDVTYTPPGLFKHLSIRERLGILNGNQRFGHYIYNRVMLEYDFLG